MGKVIGLLKWLMFRISELGLFFFLVVYMPGLPPEGTFTATKIVPARKLDGVFALNSALNNAEHIFVDKVRGPECFVEWNGELYTSVHGGEIVKLSSAGHVTHVTKIGQPCDGIWQESKCGRPLGFSFDSAGILYLMDSYYGIWKVDVKSGKKTLLVSPDVEIEGRKPKVFNSIVLASNGDFYWTDSTSSSSLEDGVFGMLLDGSGRLFHYDAAKNSSSVLLDGLWFANGVALSPNEEFVVVVETARAQIRRYYLKGPNKGTDDVFIDGLIGLPDNLKVISDGLLVPLVVPRDENHPVIFQTLAPHPNIRKFLARILALIEMPFALAHKFLPHYVFERAKHMIGHFESVQSLVPKRTTILKLDWNGEVVESWHNLDGTLTGISEVHVFNNKLYFGSPYNAYIGRTPLPSGIKAEVKSTPVKPTQATRTETPKPTPAPTPKPTEAPKPKPTEPPKPKPTEAPKPKPTEAMKPKPVEPKVEAVKQKPVEVQKPKPAEVPKPKPTEAPKPKPTEAPKPKPTEAPKPKEAPKVEKPKEQPKPKNEKPTPASVSDKTKPVEEEILSDTRQPKEETLKVIKKGGPVEMPDPGSKNNQGTRAKTESKTAPVKNEL